LADLRSRRGSRLALVAPREGAKSTWLTTAYALRCAVEAWEPHIVLLSDSGEMAAQFLSAIRVELEHNDALAAVYPDACGAGAEWRGDRVRLKNGVLVKSLGRGSNIRGRKDRQNRPSLVIVDDSQGNEDINSPTERARTLSWFLREVIPAGSDRTNFISVGSALHREALAVVLLARAGWTGRTFRAVHRWPDRMDLWSEWERLATNLADDHRAETAAVYLKANHAEIRGARTFWPDFKPIDVLMQRRAEIGAARFETEYQGVPASPEGAEWPPELFDRPDFWFDQWPADIVLKIQGVDPSKGVTDKADYQAHVSIALQRRGVLYVDAELRRESAWVERAIELAYRFGAEELVAEANNTMGLLTPTARQVASEYAKLGKLIRFPVVEKISSAPKPARIRRLSEYLRLGNVRFRNTPGCRLLVEQLRDWPTGAFDDGPDVLATTIIHLEKRVKP
jgi:hypothetical protein